MADEVVAPADMTFGAALAELEQIVRALETGQLELEESLARYERGVALLTACQKKLSEARQKVTALIGELESDEGEGEDAS
ncbi:MAG: exodeoxyribonuclease VII small subunit [Actinomycetota bacterium]|jgi:exodeoxyribonuclease VII small subunit